MRKIATNVRAVFIVLLLLLLSGCERAGFASAEEAAANQILENPGDGVVIDPSTLESLQQQRFSGSTYVVMTYRRMWNARDQQCVVMFDTRRELLGGWTAGGGGGLCMELVNGVLKEDDPLHISGGTTFHHDDNRPDLSHVIGFVTDPAAERMRIIWEDGQADNVEIVKGSFITLRSGDFNMKTAECLSETGAVVCKSGG